MAEDYDATKHPLVDRALRTAKWLGLGGAEEPAAPAPATAPGLWQRVMDYFARQGSAPAPAPTAPERDEQGWTQSQRMGFAPPPFVGPQEAPPPSMRSLKKASTPPR